MPYVTQDRRKMLDNMLGVALAGLRSPEYATWNPGDLNYIITRICDAHLMAEGELSYQAINEVIGALECAKLEMYRRVAGPYEDWKRDLNGDVYESGA